MSMRSIPAAIVFVALVAVDRFAYPVRRAGPHLLSRALHYGNGLDDWAMRWLLEHQNREALTAVSHRVPDQSSSGDLRRVMTPAPAARADTGVMRCHWDLVSPDAEKYT